ncbi:MAG: DUF6394 family protein [Propionicimonas sp.]|uniref:DUF6394 family protein n=1 Tax=Propionicimonas sp. TaxID=1955623 RepID=UPI002B2204A8|nr:DUF6394 family protein [Propionicimonas sp.]MEA4945468.1 DUF6394 family protein [Propionicimonas sp.]MEA5117439.1 DUF6394 family protein [Propionicimonas sp.]
MNFEKVVFGFFIILAATLNLGFFLGDMANPAHHNVYQFVAAIVVSVIATVLKFGDRTQLGAVHLATSLVADVELIIAAVVWVWASQISASGVTEGVMVQIVSMSGGALLANTVSVVLMVTETLTSRR